MSAGRISGSVIDAQGAPVDGARDFFTAGPVPLPDIAAVTGADGRFELTAPAPGDYTVACAGETGEGESADGRVRDGDVEVTLTAR